MENKKDEAYQKQYTLLIVDDLLMNRSILKSFLSEDYNIEEAKDGKEALDMIRDHGERINLIISDNHMENMSGLELLERLSANPWLKKLPVIMMSSDQTQEFVNRAYELGAADFFFLPIIPLLVKHRVKYTLENYQRHKEELLNSVHCVGDFYFILMQIDLKNDTCEIMDTSEYMDMWDKNIGTCASTTIKLFTEYGYIHPEDLPEFLEFTAPKNLQKKFLKGTVKTHFRYRRFYQGEYRWALMEVTRSKDYSETNQTVIMFSRDIQDEVDEHNKTMEVVAAHAASTDYCNITRNYFYHDVKANYIAPEMKEMDTITEMIEWGASKIQIPEIRKQYEKVFSREYLIDTFNHGESMVFLEYPYRTPETGIKLFRTTVQMFRNAHTRDIEGIYYVENIGKEFVQKRIAENIFYHDYVFVGVWDTEYGDIYIHKTGDNLFQAEYRLRVPYKDIIDYRVNRQSLPINEYQKKTSPEYILSKLETMDEYTLVLDTTADDGGPCTLEYVYRYFMREYKVLAIMVRNITASAEQDSVTKGMNQKGFFRKVEWFLSNHPKRDYDILYFNIQDFKAINELLGFESGNRLLEYVRNMLNESALQPVYIGRLMADQFVCLVKRDNVSRNVLSGLCRSEVKEYKLPIILRMHCGIYEIEEDDIDVRSMCDKAKIALNRIENEFTTPYSWFEKDMNKRYLNQLQVVNNISNALENKEFVVFYQPIFDAKTKKLISAEALVRWCGVNKEYIRPDIFIPVLEEKGIISQLDWYVATEVYNFIQRQKEKGAAYVPVSINLSQMDFYNKKMLGSILEMLEASKIKTDNFRFEITESSFADVNKLDHEFLEKLRAMGSKILIDDFGTGYSSLASITKQKFDVLKIDMSFVREIGVNVQTEAVIRSIIDMAHRMGAYTVAEGVETEAQFQFLRENNCDCIQGYYFSKPLVAEDFEVLLAENN